MREYIEIFKRLWSNKRIRALIILGLYAIFFTIVIVAVSGKKEIKMPVRSALIEYRDNKNYQYELIIDNASAINVKVIEGYTVSIPDEVEFLDSKFIYDLTELGKLEGINSNYANNYKDSIYTVKGSDVISLIDINSDVTLTIREREDRIEKVIIEFDQAFNGVSSIELNY